MEDGGGSAQQERILCQNFVDLRRYRRSSMAKSLVAKSTKSESNLEVGLPRTVRQQPTFVFWRETFSYTFSSGAKMSRAFACADQRLMASPLRQTSHSAMYRGFLPPFHFFVAVDAIFFHRPLLTTTLAKKIETTARTWRRRLISRACTRKRLCLACVPVSIFLARVVIPGLMLLVWVFSLRCLEAIRTDVVDRTLDAFHGLAL